MKIDADATDTLTPRGGQYQSNEINGAHVSLLVLMNVLEPSQQPYGVGAQPRFPL